MSWHSGTNIVLAVIILLLAAAHRVVGVDPLLSFWMILLIGITAAITARLSLYVWHVAVPQQSTEKNHRPVCRVECLGLLCSTSHLALRGMNHAQDFTGWSADFDDRPWSDYFAR